MIVGKQQNWIASVQSSCQPNHVLYDDRYSACMGIEHGCRYHIKSYYIHRHNGNNGKNTVEKINFAS